MSSQCWSTALTVKSLWSTAQCLDRDGCMNSPWSWVPELSSKKKVVSVGTKVLCVEDFYL